ncbi:MAG TPA: alkaline phosphatase family protein, partial [Verrucomicrobiae bacterium]|nr:alkaline phosphatase family protein [Verrucomicrobiae bacterium]
LFYLSRQGVWFDNHHPVFVSATEVNGTTIATGAYPGHDGVVGNKEFRPEIDPLKPFHTEDFESVRKGDGVSRGHYIRVPTVAEILHKKGMDTVIAGAKPVALLLDRFERPAGSHGVNLFAGQTLPPNVLADIISREGAFPSTNSIHLTRNDWTTQAMIDSLWRNGVPAFSLLWMNEPDATQHATGPGSSKSLAAIRNADDNLARVLRALEARGVRGQTDIILVSDHGFSTVLSLVDLADALNNAGFSAAREFKSAPANGDILVCGNGGSVPLYVTGHDKSTIGKLVKFLQGWSYTGVVFTRQPMQGAFTLAQAQVDSPNAPDVLVSMRWKPDHNDVGAPGMLICDLCPYAPGQGMHGSLSVFDMHNTCVAAGPDFRSGVVDHLPTGNVDIAPTVMWILGVKKPKSMDGRVVTEVLVNAKSEIKSFKPNHLEATRELDDEIWTQYLNFEEVNGVTYLEEGNGHQSAKQPMLNR